MLAGKRTPSHLSDAERERQEINAALAKYEGLIYSTSQRLVASGVELEHEDIAQHLRIRVWKALRSYDPEKARGMDERRYCFMVLRDGAKDLAKKKRRRELKIEDIAPSPSPGWDRHAARDKFERRYLSEDHDTVFAEVEDELPELPNTLSERERLVLLHMYRDHKQTEIAEILGITKREVESSVRSIRAKMADWRPGESESTVAAVA